MACSCCSCSAVLLEGGWVARSSCCPRCMMDGRVQQRSNSADNDRRSGSSSSSLASTCLGRHAPKPPYPAVCPAAGTTSRRWARAWLTHSWVRLAGQLPNRGIWLCSAQAAHLLRLLVTGSGRQSQPSILLSDDQAEALPPFCVAGVLGEGPADAFNPDLLRDEPADKVRCGAGAAV